MSDYPSDWDSRRESVYKRDDHECQNCGRTRGSSGNIELHAHHVVPKSKGGTHEVSNLITVCNDCHKAIHNKSKTAPSKNSIDIDTDISRISSIEDILSFNKKYNSAKEELAALPGMFDNMGGPELSMKKVVNDRDELTGWAGEVRRDLLEVKYLSKNIDIDALHETSENKISSGQSIDRSDLEADINRLVDVTIDFVGCGVEICQTCIDYIESLSHMRCKNCGELEEYSASFCGSCGEEVIDIWNCTECGNMRDGFSTSFCRECGSEYPEIPESKRDNINRLEQKIERLRDDVMSSAKEHSESLRHLVATMTGKSVDELSI